MIMDRQGRKRLEEITEMLCEIRDELTEAAEREMEKYDNLPDGIQDSDKGMNLYETAETLQEQSDTLSDIITEIYDIANIK